MRKNVEFLITLLCKIMIDYSVTVEYQYNEILGTSEISLL